MLRVAMAVEAVDMVADPVVVPHSVLHLVAAVVVVPGLVRFPVSEAAQ